MEEQLLKIFEGNSELFITTSLTGEVDERGKTVGQTLTVHEPVTLQIWKEHLENAFLPKWKNVFFSTPFVEVGQNRGFSQQV